MPLSIRRLSLALLALAVVPASAEAARIGIEGTTRADRRIAITGDAAVERWRLNISSRAAVVDSEEVVTVTGRFPTLTLQGCTVSSTDAAVSRTVTCVVPISAPVVVNMGGGNDELVASGSIESVFPQDLPEGARALSVSGGDGDDVLRVAVTGRGTVGFPDPVVVNGQADDDAVTLGAAPGIAAGGTGNDVVTALATPMTLQGGSGQDKLVGGTGDDLLEGGPGGDVLNGGGGFDTVAYEDGTRTAGVEVTLDGLCNDGGPSDTRPVPPIVIATTGAPADGCSPNGTDRDNVQEAEVLTGTRFADVLVGGTQGDEIFGLAGDDLVEGAGFADVLHGGTGADTVLGRDQQQDRQIICEGTLAVTGAQPNPGDRAILDQFDPANPDCTSIERGGQGVTGPSDPSPAPAEPAPGQPATPTPPPPPPPAGLLSGGTELGTLPGGGVAGRPPQARILARRATPDARGRLPLRLACVYRARACAATLTLRAPRTLRVGSGRRVVRIAKGTVLGRARLTVPWGRSAPVLVPLQRRFRTLLSRSRRPVAVRLTAVVRDDGQGDRAVPVTLTATITVGRRGGRS